MKDKKVLTKKDIVLSDSDSIEMILNSNYSNVIYSIRLYTLSLLLDISTNKDIGYSFYQDILYMYEVESYDIINYELDILAVSKDIKYLESLIFNHLPINNIVDTFCNNTNSKYRVLEKELRLYIDALNTIIIDKII